MFLNMCNTLLNSEDLLIVKVKLLTVYLVENRSKTSTIQMLSSNVMILTDFILGIHASALLSSAKLFNVAILD